MRNKKVNKLWKGIMVSVRDYEVADAIEKGGLRITHNDQTMILTPDELRMLKPSSKKFQSRYNQWQRLSAGGYHMEARDGKS